MRVLVCGSRYWKDYGMMFNVVVSLGKIDVIIEGDSRGADRMARRVGEAVNIPVLTFFADWAVFCDAAGPIRNERMLKEGKPNIVLAFHDDIEKSKGTKHMVNIALKAGIPVWIYSHKGRTFMRPGDGVIT